MNKWISIFGITLTLFTTICRAEDIDSLLLFGDSYFDTGAGNAVAEADGVPLVSPIPPYFDGRHSNGPIWIDYTSAQLDLPVINFAVAGSETGTFNVNIPPDPNPIGGLFQQLGRYEATSTHIPKSTLVVIDGAGNDFLALLNPPITPPGPTPADFLAAATQAITNLGTVVLPTLQALGAEKIILWNLGDLSMLPLFNSPIFPTLNNPTVRAAFQAASIGFNEALVPVIKTLNSEIAHLVQGTSSEQQIFIFDAFTAFNTLAAELTAQGEDLSQFSIISQYGGPYNSNPLIPPGTDPNSLPFYDQVHPTTASWALFAPMISAYIDTIINAPRFVAAQVDLALETANAHRDVIENHFRTLHTERYIYNRYCNDCCLDDCCDNWWDGCCGRDCFQLYIDGEGKWGNTSTRSGNLGLDYNTQLGLIGLDYRFAPNTTVGASFTYQTSYARVKENHGSMRLNDYIPTIYATYFGPCYYLDIASNLHCYQFSHVKRKIPFMNLNAKGHLHGWAGELNVDAGYVGHWDCLTYIPLIGFDFEHLVLGRYHEHGASIYNMGTHRQHQRSFISKVGAQLFYNLWDECSLVFAEILYEHEFLRNGRLMGTRFVGSTDGAVDYNHTSPVRRDMLKYSIGLDAKYDSLVGNISYVGETNFKEYSNGIRAQLDWAF